MALVVNQHPSADAVASIIGSAMTGVDDAGVVALRRSVSGFQEE
jgi:hypothetical protein